MNKKLLPKLSKLNIAIVAHVFASGPALDLEQYLEGKAKGIIFIGHPFPFSKDKRSFLRIREGEKVTIEKRGIGWKLPEPFGYFKDAFYTLFWISQQNKKVDLYVGSDGFSAYLGLLLKNMGKVKKVVFYTIDYVPQRFPNFVLNAIYHYFDRKCLEECNIVWNVSPKMEEARRELKGIGGEGYSRQITVPLGMWDKRIPKLTFSQKERYRIAFLGHVLEKQGLDVVIESLPSVIKKIPKVQLIILGSGEHEQNLKTKVKRLKVEDYVDFRGFIPDHKDVEKELASSMVGIAMYKPVPENYTYFADPAKLKNYLSAGLPIILTDVPPIVRELEKQECAIISAYDKDELAKKIVKLLKDERILKDYRKNALNFATQYDWDNVFQNALKTTLSI